MSYERRLTPSRLKRDYRDAARAGNWDTCRFVVTQLYRMRLEGADLVELIYADGYWREHAGDVDNARRCYTLAVEKGHPKAARRLVALGGLPAPQPLLRWN